MTALARRKAPALPALIADAGDAPQNRFWEFFVNHIRNAHTRRAYSKAIGNFLVWCESQGVASIADVRPLHVGTYVELLTHEKSAPTAKQHLAAIRMLFDWLVTGQIVPTNPGSSVRGPRHVVKIGKTPALDPPEARVLLDSIDASTPVGLRDRALINLMRLAFRTFGPTLARQSRTCAQ